MATKTLTQSAAELLLSGQTTLACKVCVESNWTKAPPAWQTKKPGMLTVRCRTCANAASLAGKNERYATNEAFREAQKAYYKERYATDGDYREAEKVRSKARYATDEDYREAEKARSKERYATDEDYREAQKVRSLQWAKGNPGKANANTAKRRATKKQATPKWADLQAIQAFYEACPEGMHVDHIFPLQGELVSGLHVRENLQYLTASENISKGNKFVVT